MSVSAGSICRGRVFGCGRTYITRAELRKEADGVLELCGLLGHHMLFTIVAEDDGSLVPYGQILEVLFCARDDPLGNWVCRIGLSARHDFLPDNCEAPLRKSSGEGFVEKDED